MFSPPSDDQKPVLWIGEHPIHASLFVVLVYTASMLVTAVLKASHIYWGFAWLAFDSAAVLHGEVWRILTYGLVNPPSLWFVVDMFLLAWFGRELEKFFGRRVFFTLFGCLYLVTPLLFTALGPWWPTAFVGETGSLAIFVAFATLYPGAMMIFNLLAKWVALVLVGIYTLINLADRNLTALVMLWATCGFAYLFVRHQQGAITLPSFTFRRSGAGSRKTDAPVPPKISPVADLDAVLDKIARSGIGSLTSGERARLEAGRAALLKRKGPGNG
jgi:hypothetical protein